MMTKKNTKSKLHSELSKHKVKYVLIGSGLVILLVSFFTYFSSPQISVQYFSKVLDKLGAPAGFTINHARDDTRSSFIEDPYMRRTYNGTSQFSAVRDEILQRLHDLGFKNAQWRSRSGATAEGVIATCKGMTISVGLYASGDDPIDIEIFRSNTEANAPNCPWL